MERVLLRAGSPFPHPDDEVEPSVADEGPDVAHLDHDRREEGEHLFVEEVMDKLLVEGFRLAVGIELDILPVQFGQHLVEDAVIVPLLPVHLVGDGRQGLFSLICTLFGIVLLEDDTSMFGHPDLVELLQIGRVDGQELDPFIDRQRAIFRL